METSSEELIMEPHRHVIRGKRTKRSRLSTAATSSSSACCSLENDACFSIISPQSCENSGYTEEDEDMANCLIFLAQSGSSLNPKQEHDEEIHNKKLSTGKFSEMGISTTEKAEFYVYECKTCNRNFPSFQALGGHRASHKRPKPEEKKVLISTLVYEKEDDQVSAEFKNLSPSIFQQKAKVHECSVCGSEFSSGQALGGHMRKHRIPTTNTTSTHSRNDQEDENPRNVLKLDLNLPAPEDHDHYNSKFQFVFSAQALVGCRY